MKNKEEIIDRIYLILLCMIIAMLNLFIGSNHQEPKTILETIILILGLTYIVIQKIKNKKNIIIKGKIDRAILLLVIATFIPLLIKSYYSLNDTINFAIEYVCVYVIYILVRNILKKQKDVNILIDATLISSIVIIIFGLDKLYFNVFKYFLDFIDSAKSNAYGMISTIGYSNPLATYMSLLSFLALGRYLCIENKWIKALFSSYIQIAMIGFVFGNSRALMVMLPIIFIIYLITLKDNQKRLEAIAIIGGNLLVAYLFQAICNKFVTSNLILWLLFILDLIFVYLINLIVDKIINKFKIKINKMKILIILVIIGALFVTYCLVVKNIGEPVTLDIKNNYIELLGLKNNENYNIKINLNVSRNLDKDDLNNNIEDKQVKITIGNYTSQRIEKKVGEVVLKNGEQNLEFNIQTTQDFERMRIHINNLRDKNYKVTINHVYINGKEYIIKYKYLPNDVIRMLRTLNPRTVSIYERIAFCKDSLKLAQNHLIFGAGGSAFENHIKPYQTYVHGYNGESHSYILDLLLNYGIFGLLIYVVILIITIYNAYKTIKNKREESNLSLYISILFGILLFTLHATIDYDLNYLVTISIYYMFIAIINIYDGKLENKNSQKTKVIIIDIFDYAIIVALIAILTLTIPKCFADYLVKQEEYQKAYNLCNYSENIKYKIIYKAYITRDISTLDSFLELYVKDEKYKKNFNIFDGYCCLIITSLEEKRNDIAIKNLEAFYRYITEHDNICKVNNSEIILKKQKISNLLKKIEIDKDALEDEQVLKWYNAFKIIIYNT